MSVATHRHLRYGFWYFFTISPVDVPNHPNKLPIVLRWLNLSARLALAALAILG